MRDTCSVNCFNYFMHCSVLSHSTQSPPLNSLDIYIQIATRLWWFSDMTLSSTYLSVLPCNSTADIAGTVGLILWTDWRKGCLTFCQRLGALKCHGCLMSMKDSKRSDDLLSRSLPWCVIWDKWMTEFLLYFYGSTRRAKLRTGYCLWNTQFDWYYLCSL